MEEEVGIVESVTTDVPPTIAEPHESADIEVDAVTDEQTKLEEETLTQVLEEEPASLPEQEVEPDPALETEPQQEPDPVPETDPEPEQEPEAEAPSSEQPSVDPTPEES